ncbi:MAG: hypothetical protein ABEJ43_08435 [Haloferacaceae archaeon]
MSETEAGAETSGRETPPDGRPERPGVGPLVERLRVRRNALVGAAVGVLVAALLYAVRVGELLGPFSGTQSFPVVGPEGWFLLLAFVLASSTAVVVATLLTLVTGYAVVREATRETGAGSEPGETGGPDD